MTRAVLILLAVALSGLAWALPWPDPAQAGAALQWCGWIVLCALLARGPWAERAAATLGIVLGVAGASCAAWWRVLSQVEGTCDEGTGRPVTAVAAVAVLWVAAQLMREVGGNGGRSGG